MAEEAVAPAVDEIGCVRAFVTPEVASAFEDGHRLRVLAFFVAAQVPLASLLPFKDGWEPLVVWDDGVAETVVVVEPCDDSEDEELDLCTLFLGMNILSSEFIP